MGFFDEYYKADEPASMEYSHTDRFLWYLFGDGAEKMKHGAALSSAVRKEMDSLFSTGGKPCRFPEYRRPFHEFSLEIKSTILLCTRITNLHKAVYIFNKCGGDGSEVLAERFRRTCIVLHAEYNGLYGEEYISPASSSGTGGIHSSRPEEDAIRKDFPLYFNIPRRGGCGTNDFCKTDMGFHMLRYMASVYAGIEVEMFLHDIDGYISDLRRNADFIKYYKGMLKATGEGDLIKDGFAKYTRTINMELLSPYIRKKTLYVINGHRRRHV